MTSSWQPHSNNRNRYGNGGSSSSNNAAMDDQAASLLESQNNESVNSLHAKIKAIKGISINLHDDVNTQNQFLEEMSHSFTQVGDGLKSSARRMQSMLSTPHGQQTCTMAALVLILLISIWVLWAKWSK
ncbi:hypothetical protein BC830DRAFT_1128113 [Chytriomyces sp. MP71]|nr:hypothetical protein BC830DRAFT_1128113 [Chytriomyces sp. MP71]